MSSLAGAGRRPGVSLRWVLSPLASLLIIGCGDTILQPGPEPEPVPCVQHITITDHFIAGLLVNPIGPNKKSKREIKEDVFGFSCTQIAEGIVWIPQGNFSVSADYITYDCARPC